MGLKVANGDITYAEVDAVVNAANPQLQKGSGVCGAIFEAAGSDELEKECAALAPVERGQAVVTGAYNMMFAKYIVHAVGPVWEGGDKGEEGILRKTYINAITAAKEKGCKTIAIPVISSGVYGYPMEQAVYVAMEAITAYLDDNNNDMDVILVMH